MYEIYYRLTLVMVAGVFFMYGAYYNNCGCAIIGGLVMFLLIVLSDIKKSDTKEVK